MSVPRSGRGPSAPATFVAIGLALLGAGGACGPPPRRPPAAPTPPAPTPAAPATQREERPVQVAPGVRADAPVSTASDSARDWLFARLEPCRRKALATYPDARRRFLAGLPPRHGFFVTTRLRDDAGRVEQVFVAVDRIAGGWISGRLWSDVGIVAGYRQGQPVDLPETSVVDWMISRPDGTEEGNWMGRFLDAFQTSGRPPVGVCDP